MSYNGGASDQKLANYKDAMAQTAEYARLHQQQSQFDQQQTEQKRLDDATLARDKVTTDAASAVNDQNKKIAGFEAGLKYPKNYGTFTPEQKRSYLDVRYNEALKAGDWSLAQETRAKQAELASGDQKLAAAGETRNKPAELQMRLDAADKMLTQRLGAQRDNVLAQIQGRITTTGMTTSARRDIAVMVANAALQRIELAQAGATGRNAANINAKNAQINVETEARLYGIDLNAIVREQTDVYNQQMANFRKAELPGTPYDPSASGIPAAPQFPQMPTFNIYAGGQGAKASNGMDFTPLPTSPNANGSPAPIAQPGAAAGAPPAPARAAGNRPLPRGGFASIVGASGAQPGSAPSDPIVDQEFALAKESMGRPDGPTLEQVIAFLETRTNLSPQQKAALEARLQGRAVSAAPSNGGAPKASGPFPSLPF